MSSSYKCVVGDAVSFKHDQCMLCIYILSDDEIVAHHSAKNKCALFAEM